MKRELDAIPTNEITQAAKLANQGLGEIKSEMADLNKDLTEKVGAVTKEVEDVANTRLDEQSERLALALGTLAIKTACP